VFPRPGDIQLNSFFVPSYYILNDHLSHTACSYIMWIACLIVLIILVFCCTFKKFEAVDTWPCYYVDFGSSDDSRNIGDDLCNSMDVSRTCANRTLRESSVFPVEHTMVWCILGKSIIIAILTSTVILTVAGPGFILWACIMGLF